MAAEVKLTNGYSMEMGKLILDYLRTLVWPVTVAGLAIYFRQPLIAASARLRKATLPGGVSLDFQEQLQKVQDLSEEVKILPAKRSNLALPVAIKEPEKIKAPNQLIAELGFEVLPSDLDIGYFLTIAKSDTTLAIAALRIELESVFRSFVMGLKLPLKRPHETTRNLVRTLHKHGALDDPEYILAETILDACNKVVHGQRISFDQANDLIRSADVFFRRFEEWLRSAMTSPQ